MRDYSLASAADAQAVANGLADAEWYRSPISPDRLQSLSVRTNGRAAIDLLLYVALLVGSAVLLYWSLWSWWTLPAAFVYGTLYGSSSDPRWHECGHGTAFRSSVLNNLVYFPASFMLLREATLWRWSHVRHHSDTIVVGRDPEIILARPPQLGDWLPNLIGLKAGTFMMRRTVRHATGNISAADESYLPEHAKPLVVREARMTVTIWLAVLAGCLVLGSAVPLLFVIGPSFYGAWLMLVLGTTQHLGLREDVLDHRQNTRTIYLNPVLRFLYLNMNYHAEHHMFPQVPYHALPRLHREIQHDMPTPLPSLIAAYREVVPALRRQHTDPSWEIPREIPVASAASGGAGASSDTAQPRSVGGGAFDVGDDQSVRPGHVVRVDIGDRTFALYRVGRDIFATDGICTHSRSVHLATGTVVGDQIECPKHNGRFDIASGEPRRAPVCEALGTYRVVVVDGRLVLEAGLKHP